MRGKDSITTESRMKIVRLVVLLFLIQIVFPRKAYAYLDPATGSYVLQIIIAALVGGLFVIKRYFDRIKGFFKSLFSRGEKT